MPGLLLLRSDAGLSDALLNVVGLKRIGFAS